MKKIVTWIILSMLAAVVAVWNIACGISESYRYRRDRDCAIMTTGQAEYSKMKNEDYIKGTYYIEPKISVRCRSTPGGKGGYSYSGSYC